MDIPGFAGKVLYIDLSTGKTGEEPLDENMVQGLLGGYGINNRLIHDAVPPNTDPFSPDNAIILGAGPFAGTLVPGAAKLLATTRFPINGAFGTAAGGGSFAMMLKSAGYDHAVITGKARKPVYLKIAPEGAELCDASGLWGQDSFDTIDALRSLYEPCSVVPIGPAGENLVKISITSVDKAGTLGRGGLPAVMGSKNLKAIVVQQGTSPVTVADRPSFLRLMSRFYQRISRWPNRQFILDNGLIAPPEDTVEIHRNTRRPLACAGCPLADKESIELPDGPYAGLKTYMPHVTVERFQSTGSEQAYRQSVKYIDALNRYGIGMMNFTGILHMVTGLYEKGIITARHTGGMELDRGIDTALKLLHMTAHRQGFGAVMAEGIAGAAEILGDVPPEYIGAVKRQSMVYEFDPRVRGMGTMEFEQLTYPRGSHVAAAGSPAYEPGRPAADFARHGERMGIPGDALSRVVGADSFNPARFSRYSEDWYSLFNCVGLCNRAHVNRFYHASTIAELYATITGIDLAPAELMKRSERAWTVGKLLNAREGFTRQDDRPPESWFHPVVQEGKEHHLTDYYHTTRLRAEDVDRFLDDYYDERGYDRQSGLPTEEKLRELGLP